MEIQRISGDPANGIPPQVVYNYSYLFDDQSYAAAYMTVIEALFASAVESSYQQKSGGNATAVAVPDMILKQFAVPINVTTPTPTASPSPAVPRNAGQQKEYILVPLAAFITIAIGQFAASAILPLTDELNKQIFQTLRLHGCSAAAYWMGTLLYDSISSVVLVAAHVAGAYIRVVHQLQSSILVFQSLVLMLTVVNVLLMAYGIVLMLPAGLKPNTYIYVVAGSYYLTMLIPLMIEVAMSFAGTRVPDWIKMITPGMALFSAISFDPDTPTGAVWADPRVKDYLMSCALWNIPWVLIILRHAYFTTRQQRLPCCAGAVPPSSRSVGHDAVNSAYARTLDIDVAQEQARVDADPTSSVVAALHLRKMFTAQLPDSQKILLKAGNEKTPLMAEKAAVEDSTFGIYQGECFGLLGPNGAGKTTTIKMMTRETCPTSGHVLYQNYNGGDDASDIDRGLLGNIDHGFQCACLGCCQQGDTLWDNLSAKEHLEVYLRCRLGPLFIAKDWETYIQNAINKVDLAGAAGKQTETFSGGMKRKLSVCIAMYTGAKVVFLDEPSTGMDPYARRALWKTIHEALRNDRAVLLTTHSMEEADAVCGRIAIMTNGVLRCIGSSQHLKNRFGSGYTIVITLLARDQNGNVRRDDPHAPPQSGFSPMEDDYQGQVGPISVTTTLGGPEHLPMDHPDVLRQNNAHGIYIDEQMQKTFELCELKEVLGLQRRYAVLKLPSLSFAFTQLQTNTNLWGISNYSISQQTTLEQIFIHFAGGGT